MELGKIAAIAATCIMVGIGLAGCVGSYEEKSDAVLDTSAILPSRPEDKYHTNDQSFAFIQNLNATYPNFIDVFSIGKSVQGRDIWCFRLTNEKNKESKLSCLFDGCTHGNEFESTEFCLYLAEYLLINYENNATARRIVDSNEIYFIPIVNPDGHEANTRHNANGVNLNRNYDVDWGNPLGMAFIDPMSATKHTYENCGPAPFSEPESRAMRDFMETLHNRNFAFYLPLHTANHAIEAPWGTMDAPFEMPERDYELFEFVLQWTRDNTEYEGGRFEWGNATGGQPMAASGTAQDWCYMRHRVPSLTMELFQGTIDDHSNLNYWMLATLPVGLYMLTNIENFYNWETPNVQPVLPEGVPPSN